MYRNLLIIQIFSLLSSPSLAGDLFSFNGAVFGDFPEQSMVCVSGDCDPDAALVTFRPRKKPIATSYLRERDLSHYGRVPLAHIYYDYFDEKLFRIRMLLACPPKDTPACLESVIEKLMLTYSMGLVQADRKDGDIVWRSYVIDNSILVLAKSDSSSSDRDYPMVELRDKALTDEVRKKANPRYVKIPIGGK